MTYTIFIPLNICIVVNLLPKDKNIYLDSSASNRDITIKTKQIIFLLLTGTLLTTGIYYYFNCDKGIFLRARDYLLLSSIHGEALSDFYYRYTLYAAEAIKPSSRINKATAVLEKQPETNKLSSDTLTPDHQRVMRCLCVWGLTIVSPIILYSSSFLLIYYLVNFILINLGLINLTIVKKREIFISGIVAGTVNILISLSILNNLYPLTSIHKPISIKAMLEHSDYRIRTEGLRELCKNSSGNSKNIASQTHNSEETIWRYSDFINAFINGNIVEKYWLANAFAAAKNPDAIYYLKKLIKDQSINVQCASIDAMTNIATINQNISFSVAIAHILNNKVVNSNEWYVQQRAYNSLRKLAKFNCSPK